ncbi:MAG: hypothetical protein MSS94_10580, partial [Clostridiales bacterium]|nr:hypothetical protein [Clostridiales bacterium]
SSRSRGILCGKVEKSKTGQALFFHSQLWKILKFSTGNFLTHSRERYPQFISPHSTGGVEKKGIGNSE